MRKFFSLVIFFHDFILCLCWKSKQYLNHRYERVSEETIKAMEAQSENYSEADLNEILRKLYETNFFENVKINLENQTY